MLVLKKIFFIYEEKQTNTKYYSISYTLWVKSVPANMPENNFTPVFFCWSVGLVFFFKTMVQHYHFLSVKHIYCKLEHINWVGNMRGSYVAAWQHRLQRFPHVFNSYLNTRFKKNRQPIEDIFKYHNIGFDSPKQ